MTTGVGVSSLGQTVGFAADNMDNTNFISGGNTFYMNKTNAID